MNAKRVLWFIFSVQIAQTVVADVSDDGSLDSIDASRFSVLLHEEKFSYSLPRDEDVLKAVGILPRVKKNLKASDQTNVNLNLRIWSDKITADMYQKMLKMAMANTKSMGVDHDDDEPKISTILSRKEPEQRSRRRPVEK